MLLYSWICRAGWRQRIRLCIGYPNYCLSRGTIIFSPKGMTFPNIFLSSGIYPKWQKHISGTKICPMLPLRNYCALSPPLSMSMLCSSSFPINSFNCEKTAHISLYCSIGIESMIFKTFSFNSDSEACLTICLWRMHLRKREKKPLPDTANAIIRDK